MPRVADSAVEATVLALPTTVGATIRPGDTLSEVETNRARVQISSPVAGTVLETLVSVADDVTAGAPIVIVETPSIPAIMSA